MSGKKKSGRRTRRRALEDGQVQLLQLRVTEAESVWKEAKKHAADARRRKKLVRLFAKRAKKDAKRARIKLEKVREELAITQAQARLHVPPVSSRKHARHNPHSKKKHTQKVLGLARKVAAAKKVTGIARSAKEAPSQPWHPLGPMPASPANEVRAL